MIADPVVYWVYTGLMDALVQMLDALPLVIVTFCLHFVKVLLLAAPVY